MPGSRGPIRANDKTLAGASRGGQAAGPKQSALAANPLDNDLVLTDWPEPPDHVGEHTVRIWNMLGTSLLWFGLDLSQACFWSSALGLAGEVPAALDSEAMPGQN